MSYAQNRNASAYGTCDSNFDPQAVAATATVTGAAIDLKSDSRRNMVDCGAVLHAGAATGSPTGVVSTLIVETSADGSTGWTTLADRAGSTAGVAISAVTSQSSQGNWDLTGANRYIRFSVTNALTGGSSPTLLVSVSCFISSGEI